MQEERPSRTGAGQSAQAAHAARGAQAVADLLDRAHLATPDELAGVVARSGLAAGVRPRLHLVDYQQRSLVALPLDGEPTPDPVPVDGSLPGRVFRTLEPARSRDATQLWLPLLDGVERLGVLELGAVPGVPLPEPAALRAFALLVGHFVGLKSPYGDSLDRVRRTAARTPAAELVWGLLPPQTAGYRGLVVSGVAEPAYEVAGDVFDHAVDGDVLHLAVLDAAGHDLRSGTMAAVALATYRSARRDRRGLLAAGAEVSARIRERFGDSAYCTGVLAELDRATGRLRYLNAGHPRPLLLRGGRVVKELSAGRRLPFGVDDPRTRPVLGEEVLERGDEVVLVTDGVVEARDDEGRLFGLERLVDLLERSAAARAPAPETLRRVVHAVLDHQRGILQDDATLLVAQWAAGTERALWPQ